MPEDHGRGPRPLSPNDVEIGAADADRGHPNEHVSRPGLLELDLDDLERHAGRPEERGARPHFLAAALLGFAAARRRVVFSLGTAFAFSAATTSAVGTRSAMFVRA